MTITPTLPTMTIDGVVYVVLSIDTPESCEADGYLNIAAAMRKAGQSHGYFLRRPRRRKMFMATRWTTGQMSSATSLGGF